MCLIAHRPVKNGRGSNIPNEVISYNRRKNPDGFGIAWRQNGKLQHQKFAPSDGHAFEKLLKSIDKQTHIEYVAHWRLATHGPKCEELSHPFSYNDPKAGEVLVFHNGIINSIKVDKGESDTSQFVKDILMKLEAEWWKKPHLKFLVEEAIGWSRLAIMNSRKVWHLNSEDWKNKDGIWYSTEPGPTYASSASRMPAVYSYGVAATHDQDDYMEWQDKWERTKRTLIVADENDDDTDEDDGQEILLPGASEVRSSDNYVPQSGWLDMLPAGTPGSATGHWISPIDDDDSDPAYRSGQAICEQCDTIGEYHVVNGKRYANIPHKIRVRA
jgi:predicted glutamine amidotransferase